jgi:predicted RNase H-like HicB family nuclease
MPFISPLELSIADFRLPIDHTALPIANRQSSIGNAIGGYHVFCPVLPGCHTQGETIDEGIRNIREAIQLCIDSLVEDGLPVPEEDILIKPIEIPA